MAEMADERWLRAAGWRPGMLISQEILAKAEEAKRRAPAELRGPGTPRTTRTEAPGTGAAPPEAMDLLSGLGATPMYVPQPIPSTVAATQQPLQTTVPPANIRTGGVVQSGLDAVVPQVRNWFEQSLLQPLPANIRTGGAVQSGLDAVVPQTRDWFTRRLQEIPGELTAAGRWMQENVWGNPPAPPRTVEPVSRAPDEVPMQEPPAEQQGTAPTAPPPPASPNFMEQLLQRLAGGGGGGGAAVAPINIPPPDYGPIREAYAAAAPQAPNTDPREQWLVGLLSSLAGMRQEPGERLGAMFGRMAGAGAIGGLRVRAEDRAKQDLFRREQQQHRLQTAGLEHQIGETAYDRAFRAAMVNNQQALQQAAIAQSGQNAAMTRALMAARLAQGQGSINPYMILGSVVPEVLRGRLAVPGLDMTQIDRAAAAALARDEPSLAPLLRSPILNNQAVSQRLESYRAELVKQAILSLPEEQQAAFLSRYRGLLETRPRAGSTPNLGAID